MAYHFADFSAFVKKLATNDFTWLFDIIKKYAWGVECIIILFITLVVSYGEHLFYHRVEPRLLKSKRMWQHAMLRALHAPLVCLIWLLGITFSLDFIGKYFQGVHLFAAIAPVRKVGVIILLLWWTIRWIKEAEKIFLISKDMKYHLDKTTVRAVGQVLRILVIGTSVFVILQITLGIGASGILAFAGGGSIIIGWAAKDMLANIFGGLMIFLDRPFAIGDRITAMDKKFDGYVEYIGWRLTCIRNLDRVPVYIPNSFFSNMSIENPSRMTHRRIDSTMGLRYTDAHKIPLLLGEINQMLQSHPGLDHLESCYVRLINCGAASLDILISAFTKTTELEEFYSIREDIFLKILSILEGHEVSCAYPMTEGVLKVHIEP